MSCDIIIPVWNLLDITRECIESIKKNTQYSYRIIVVDNGSADQTRLYLEDLKKKNDILLIRNDENLGFVKAVNQGMTASSAPYVCLLNNDTLVQRGWLGEMVNIIQSNKNIGIINPASNTMSHRPPDDSPDTLIKYASRMQQEFAGTYVEVSFATGFCMFIKREVIERIGFFSEEYKNGYFEDRDYSLRARQLGYSIVCAKGSYVYHKEGSSFTQLEGSKGIFEANKEVFHSKFGQVQRVLYIVTKKNDTYYKRLEEEIPKLVQGFNWATVFIKKSLKGLGLTRHGNIKVIRIGPLFFRVRCVFNILTKKKKYTDVHTDDAKLFRILNVLGKLHQARIQLVDEALLQNT